MMTAAILALALAAQSPSACSPAPPLVSDISAANLVELHQLDGSVRLDIRYATADNFLGRSVYPVARAFLTQPAAEALLRVQRGLARRGYGLVVFDAYRPWSITCLFWKLTPPEKHAFVADPAKGSQHNRGCAVDVSLVERGTGREVDMPSAYDEMSERSAPDYAGGTAEQRARRDVLRRAMEQEGFTVYSSEWWHFEYRDCGDRPLLDIPLAGLSSSAPPGQHLEGVQDHDPR